MFRKLFRLRPARPTPVIDGSNVEQMDASVHGDRSFRLRGGCTDDVVPTTTVGAPYSAYNKVMDLNLSHLEDDGIRDLMLDELNADRTSGTDYLSVHMTNEGRQRWPQLLEEAITSHDSTWLAQVIANPSYWQTHHVQQRKTGPVQAKVPSDAAPKLANGEFIIYYIRAVCMKALELGQAQVRVVRVRESSNPRPESVRLENTLLNAADLLDDVRNNRSSYTLGVPPGPNSGLAVALVD